MALKPYKKRIKGNIYRWVIQLPTDVEVPPVIYILSRNPLVLASVKELDFEFCLNLHKKIEINREIYLRISFKSIFDVTILASLVAGKNLLLVGPPGSGKTSYIRELLGELGIDYVLRTGNPEWTAFDVIGGLDLQGRWRDGFLTVAIRRGLEGGRPVWVVIDELNRANLDLALGEYFTLLDVEHRGEPVDAGGEKLRVPYSFRLLGTMNSFDRSLLQRLGFALRRRFAVVDFTRFRNLTYSGNEEREFCRSIRNRELQLCKLSEIDMKKALSIFELAKPPDYATVFGDIYEWYGKNKTSALKVEVACPDETQEVKQISISLDGLLACIVEEMNNVLKSCSKCETFLWRLLLASWPTP